MQDTKEFIDNLFTEKTLFEQEVLNVTSDHDRAEIIKILAVNIVGDILKEHLNFLYIKSLSDFTLKHIVNILFKEIASEWIDYAIDELKYSKEEALEALRLNNRVQLIKSLSQEYYTVYKGYIFREIADSFIELLALNAKVDKKSVLINAVINSNLIVDRSLLGINSSDQLCEYAKIALEAKEEKVNAFKLRLSEIKTAIENVKIKKVKREELHLLYASYEEKLKKVSLLKLDYFDENLKKVKKAIIKALLKS